MEDYHRNVHSNAQFHNQGRGRFLTNCLFLKVLLQIPSFHGNLSLKHSFIIFSSLNMAVKELKQFFEQSTIHGLYHISTVRRWPRLLWILIVIGGFCGAGYLINESFDNWKQSPISTTIETLPISQITFPNVTVCPPKESFLNLNYDLKQSEKVKLDNHKKEKLVVDSLNILQKHYYNEIMKNLSKVVDYDRYYNWYHGYTRLKFPYFKRTSDQLRFDVSTSATSGNMSTQYFAEKFNADKVDGNIYVGIDVYLPNNVKNNKNVTIMLEINKKAMKELIYPDREKIRSPDFYDDLTHYSKNITAPDPKLGFYSIFLYRKVSQDVIRKMENDTMPGFRFTWKYNLQIEPVARYAGDATTKEFVK